MNNVALAGAATLFGGALVAVQPSLNSTLSDSVGSLPAVAISFGVGFAALTVIAVLAGGATGSLSDATALPWYYVLGGGLIGAIYVTVAMVSVGALGAAGVTAATVAGQLTASVVADRFGLLGLSEREITPLRILGVLLLAAGVILIIRD